MNSKSLRELVETSVNMQWDAWASRHPNLARAIDRTKLVDATVERLRDEPALVAAMARADVDEATLSAVLRLLAEVQRLVGRALPA